MPPEAINVFVPPVQFSWLIDIVHYFTYGQLLQISNENNLTRTRLQLDYNHCHQSTRPDLFSFKKLGINSKQNGWLIKLSCPFVRK